MTLFFIVLSMADFMPKKCICREFYCTTLFKRNLQLKHLKFLLRLTATIVCQKQYAEIGLDASKIIILMLKIKNALVYWKSLKMKNWRHYFMSDASLTCRIITSWSHNSFEPFESIRNDSKARILYAVWIEA